MTGFAGNTRSAALRQLLGDRHLLSTSVLAHQPDVEVLESSLVIRRNKRTQGRICAYRATDSRGLPAHCPRPLLNLKLALENGPTLRTTHRLASAVYSPERHVPGGAVDADGYPPDGMARR